MGKTGNYKIPFDKEGNLVTYYSYDVHEWRENYEFDATLRYRSYTRGQSSVTLVFMHDGKSYEMFMTHADEVIPRLVKGRVSGRWTFRKMGRNFGIMPVKDTGKGK